MGRFIQFMVLPEALVGGDVKIFRQQITQPEFCGGRTIAPHFGVEYPVQFPAENVVRRPAVEIGVMENQLALRIAENFAERLRFNPRERINDVVPVVRVDS